MFIKKEIPLPKCAARLCSQWRPTGNNPFLQRVEARRTGASPVASARSWWRSDTTVAHDGGVAGRTWRAPPGLLLRLHADLQVSPDESVSKSQGHQMLVTGRQTPDTPGAFWGKAQLVNNGTASGHATRPFRPSVFTRMSWKLASTRKPARGSTAASFEIAKTWGQPRRPSVGGRVDTRPTQTVGATQ